MPLEGVRHRQLTMEMAHAYAAGRYGSKYARRYEVFPNGEQVTLNPKHRYAEEPGLWNGRPGWRFGRGIRTQEYITDEDGNPVGKHWLETCTTYFWVVVWVGAWGKVYAREYSTQPNFEAPTAWRPLTELEQLAEVALEERNPPPLLGVT